MYLTNKIKKKFDGISYIILRYLESLKESLKVNRFYECVSKFY